MSDINTNEISLCINIYGLGCPSCGLEIVNISYKYRTNNNVIKYNELLNFIENESKPYLKECHTLTFEKVYLYSNIENQYIAEVYVESI